MDFRRPLPEIRWQSCLSPDLRGSVAATILDDSPMFEQAFKNIDDVLWKEAGCTTELDYTEQTSWLLFLKYLDGLEQDKADEAALDRKKYTFILDKPYRWDTWARPVATPTMLPRSEEHTSELQSLRH